MDWSRLYTYDIETYPNVFSVGVVHMDTDTRWIFEISERGNQAVALRSFLEQLRVTGCRMIGFNNESFDYPVIHDFIRTFDATGTYSAADAYRKADQIIGTPWENRWDHVVWESDQVVGQIDLFKIMHFDNFARSTSLKKLEINMRSSSVEDLPYPPGTPLTPDQITVLNAYMCHDIAQTAKFARLIGRQIEFRDELSERYNMNATNYNDTKIGKQFFINELEKTGVQCFDRSSGRKKPRQTPRRDGIHVAERLIDVPFKTPELQRIHQFFKAAVIPADQTRGFFKDISATVAGFTMHFGAGGVHGSVSGRTFRRTDDMCILDADVVSYYPSLAIINRWYPEHLGEAFCDIYADVKQRRVSYAKGTPENAMLKLALNGVYGDSNNKYSPFYDPAYTMAVTINGQLLLAWLAEMIALDVPGAELIQINTDGVTVHMPYTSRSAFDTVCRAWEQHTGLDLESVDYDVMAVRDVNNYSARTLDGKIKRKNAYMTDPGWHQNHSSLVVPKAVDAYIYDGISPTDFIYGHTDPFDFMRHVKVPRSSRLTWGDDPVQGTSRYYIALSGKPLTKIMPDRTIGIDVGWMVQMCNRASEFNWCNLNRRWYIDEAEKLIRGVGA